MEKLIKLCSFDTQ